ncbi:NAD(P)-dependent oxidoreductase [Candidatus Pseudothioglobus singularis]|nr:NAD(P)-dependent oxidoreductase [Candidatus Pseudothioglobus singularis]
MNKSIWISGSRGYIGSYLKPALRDAKYELKCLSSSDTQDIDTIYIDFSNRSEIRKILKKFGSPETFIHLGWQNVYQINDESHAGLNVENSINLIDELYAAGTKRIIFVGTVSEYGDTVGILRESDEVKVPENKYVEGKVAVGNYGLKLAAKLNRTFIHTRLFYTYGAGQSHNSLINQLFECSLTKDKMSLSPCLQYRDYIYISDAVEGFRRLAFVNESGVVNLAGGNAIQLKQFVKLFWKELGANPNRLIFGGHEQPLHEQSQPKAYSDQTKMLRLTGWSPSTSISEGIKFTIDQMKIQSTLKD